MVYIPTSPPEDLGEISCSFFKYGKDNYLILLQLTLFHRGPDCKGKLLDGEGDRRISFIEEYTLITYNPIVSARCRLAPRNENGIQHTEMADEKADEVATRLRSISLNPREIAWRGKKWNKFRVIGNEYHLLSDTEYLS